MRYLLMIYGNEQADAAMSPADMQKMYQDYGRFTHDAKTAGVYISGEPLQPTSTAATVRIRGGKRVATDGPFAETKEQLGGYYLLNCKNREEAVEWAAKIPHAALGSIEVRPIMEMGEAAGA